MLQFFAFYPMLVLDLGYSKSDTAIFIAVCNAMDLVGRLAIALIGILNPNFTSRSLFMVGTVTTVAGRLSEFATVVSIHRDYRHLKAHYLISLSKLTDVVKLSDFPYLAYGDLEL